MARGFYASIAEIETYDGWNEASNCTGTFISQQKVKHDEVERQRQLTQLVSEFVSRAGAAGFTIEELQEQLHDRSIDGGKKRR